MTFKGRIPAIIFLALTPLIFLSFIKRDLFSYYPYADYKALYGPCDEECILKWQQFPSSYSSASLQEAKSYLLGKGIVKDTQNETQKILSIATFVSKNFSKRAGKPPENIRQLPPMSQLYAFTADSSLRLWCGNFGQIFSFLCWSVNIPCRYVEIFLPGNSHVFNECYLKDSGKWAFIDTDNNIFLPSTNHLLNGQEFKQAIHHGSMLHYYQSEGDSTFNCFSSASSLHVTNLFQPSDLTHYYYFTDNKKAYNITLKLKRLFLPQGWYEIYTSKPGTNWLFYTRDILVLIWLSTFIFFMVKQIKKYD